MIFPDPFFFLSVSVSFYISLFLSLSLSVSVSVSVWNSFFFFLVFCVNVNLSLFPKILNKQLIIYLYTVAPIPLIEFISLFSKIGVISLRVICTSLKLIYLRRDTLCILFIVYIVALHSIIMGHTGLETGRISYKDCRRTCQARPWRKKQY